MLLGVIQIDFGHHAKQSLAGHPEDQSNLGVATPHLARNVLIITVSAAVALNIPFVTASTSALGFCSVLFTTFALLFLERSFTAAPSDPSGTVEGLVIANASNSRRPSGAAAKREAYWACLRDFAAVVTLALVITSLMYEDFRVGGLTWHRYYEKLSPDWKTGQHWLDPVNGIVAVAIGVAQNMLMVLMVCEKLS